MTAGAAVTVEGASKVFGLHTVLDEVDLRFDAGGVYCLMGPSGVGKTTLLRMIVGLETPTRGRVVGPGLGRVAAMFQDDRLAETLTPIENVALLHPDRRISRRAIRASLAEILPMRALDQPVRELSGGMRRRVSLACALAYPAPVLVFDEPFTGLDAATRRVAARHVLNERAGRTLVVATHSEDDVELLGGVKVVLPLGQEAR